MVDRPMLKSWNYDLTVRNTTIPLDTQQHHDLCRSEKALLSPSDSRQYLFQDDMYYCVWKDYCPPQRHLFKSPDLDASPAL